MRTAPTLDTDYLSGNAFSGLLRRVLRPCLFFACLKLTLRIRLIERASIQRTVLREMQLKVSCLPQGETINKENTSLGIFYPLSFPFSSSLKPIWLLARSYCPISPEMMALSPDR